MAYESNPMTLRPQSIALGAPVTVDEAGQLPGFANWIYQTRVETHFNLTCGTQGWATAAPGTTWAAFRPIADGSVVFFRNRIKVQPEAANLVFGARVYCGGTDHCTVKVTIGATNASVTYTSADNGTEKKTTLATASTGTGWLAVTIELQKTSGTGSSYLYSVRVCDEQRTDYPTPIDE